MIRSFVLAALFLFFIDAVQNGLPYFVIDQNLTWIQYLVFLAVCLSILLGGIITDRLIDHHGIFEIFALVATGLSIIMIYIDNPVLIFITMIILGILLGLLVITFLTSLLAVTSLLNRARIITLLLFVMTAFTTPLIGPFIFFPDGYTWFWIVTAILTSGSLIITIKTPRSFMTNITSMNMEPGEEKPSVRMFIKLLRKTGMFRTGFFFFFTACTLGIYFNSAFKINSVQSMLDPVSTIIIFVIAAILLPFISAVLDTFGRKPIVYVIFFIFGVFSIFFDYPGESSFVIDFVRLFIYIVAVLLITVLLVVFAGDLSATFSRGRITGVLLFSTILGIIAGFAIRDLFIVELLSSNKILYSNLNIVLIFGVAVLYTPVKEPLQESTLNWYNYLLKLFIISDNGLSLFTREFKIKLARDNKNAPDDDVASGGLFGIQSMLQEIAKSNDRVRVLDHGDVFFIFHYGKHTTAVLLVEKNLAIFYEKLANFHLRFELYNDELIQQAFIKISELKEVEELTDQFFS